MMQEKENSQNAQGACETEKTVYRKSDFYYDLPEDLIAQTPAEPRDSSRLLVYSLKNKTIEDRIFRDIPEYLRPGDVLVVNDTKVIPARIYASTPHGGKVEVLLLKRYDTKTWEVLMRPGKKGKIGVTLTVSDELSLTVKDITETGERIVEFSYDGVFEDVLSRVVTKNSKIKRDIIRCTVRWTALPPRLPQDCISRKNCWKRSARWAWKSPKCCCTWGSARSAPFRKT